MIEKFQLNVFLKILGLGSASGIVFHQNSLYIISDNSTFLYEYKLENNLLKKHALDENPQENIAKKDKLDFEVLTKKSNKLHIIGSGSKEKRNKSIQYNLENQKVKSKDLSKLYKKFIEKATIEKDELNIEGCIFHNEFAMYFQRGNGLQGKNGIFIVENKKVIDFIAISLPKIQSIEATFTDAILVDNTIYFLAAVENSNSTYDDGEILGSFIGTINLENLTVEKSFLISEKNKFEGITLYEESKTELIFLLCEDADSEILESVIYKLTIPK